MQTQTTATVKAECGDLLLAKECVADLKEANFHGKIDLELPSSFEGLERAAFLAYGEAAKSPAARTIMLGGLIGAIAGLLLLTLRGPEQASLLGPFVRPAVVLLLGSALGALSGWCLAKIRLKEQDSRHSLILRCHGDESDIAKALATLKFSPCRNVHPENDTNLESEVPKVAI